LATFVILNIQRLSKGSTFSFSSVRNKKGSRWFWCNCSIDIFVKYSLVIWNKKVIFAHRFPVTESDASEIETFYFYFRFDVGLSKLSSST